MNDTTARISNLDAPGRARRCSSVPRRALCTLVLCLGSLIPAAAQAQVVDPQNAVAAQALYDQALAEMDAGDHVSACRKLEEVTRLVPEGIGAKLTLGECYEALGRLASAWSQYAIVEVLAARAGQPERAQKAASRAAVLRPKLASLTIEVPAEVRALPGLVITRDGVVVGEAQWGAPVPVDAGGHEMVVTATGYRPWKKPVEVVANGARVVVKVKPLEPEAPASGPRANPAQPVVVAAPAPDRTWQRPVGFAAMAAGGVGLTAGAVLGGLAIARYNASNEPGRCDEQNGCDQAGLALRSEAVGLGNASTVAFIVGGAALAGGLTLLLTAPSSPPERPPRGGAPRAEIRLTPGGIQGRAAW